VPDTHALTSSTQHSVPVQSSCASVHEPDVPVVQIVRFWPSPPSQSVSHAQPASQLLDVSHVQPAVQSGSHEHPDSQPPDVSHVQPPIVSHRSSTGSQLKP
jgi:hypothetical protein